MHPRFSRSQHHSKANVSIDARTFYKNNPDGEGLPRAFSINFADPLVGKDDPGLQKLNDQLIIFGRHCSNTTGILLNGHRVQPDDTTYVPATKSYSFATNSAPEPGISRTDMGGFISLLGAQPSGTITVGARTFNVQLDPAKVWYDVKVSNSAGASFTSGTNDLEWDSTSTQWNNATWETGKFSFGYNTRDIGTKVGSTKTSVWITENSFVDNCSYCYPLTSEKITLTPSSTAVTPAVEFDLGPVKGTGSKMKQGRYTCLMDANGVMTTVVNTAPPPLPAPRASATIKSVFPTLWKVQ